MSDYDFKSPFRGKHVTVMGLGRFGGGVAAARFLAERGARVTVTDTATDAQLVESLGQLDGIPIKRFALGGHFERDFLGADLIVANPAIPRTNPYLALASAAGIPLTSEMNLFWQFNRGRVIGVTGSNGKSTTTALIHAMVKASGRRCWLGGNIGRSLLPHLEEIESDDWVILEISSFQLEDLDRLPSSPHVAVVTNFAPNHLDWHGSLDAYRRAKQSILRWQSPADIAVLNVDDSETRRWPSNGRRLGFGLEDCGALGVFLRDEIVVARDASGERALELREWLRLPGRHNLQNAMAAACAALAIGISPDAIRRGIEEYEPLPHRLQFIAEIRGRRFYNDSLATTPESTAVALESFDQPVVLLAGGYDKQVELSGMAAAIAARAKAVALMGQTGPALDELLVTRFDRTPTCRRVCVTFCEAFGWAIDQSQPGDVVLLSPGCASYDWFRNFADRGDQFAARVRNLAAEDKGDEAMKGS